MTKTKKLGLDREKEETRERKRQQADHCDVQRNLVFSASVVKAEKPVEIPRGMTIKRYQSILVQYGD